MPQTYYCEGCREKHGFKETDVIKEKRCSFCREVEECYVSESSNLIPTKKAVLPKPKRNTGPGPSALTPGAHISVGDEEEETTFAPTAKKKSVSKDIKEVLEITADKAREMREKMNKSLVENVVYDILKKVVDNAGKENILHNISTVDSRLEKLVVEDMNGRGFKVNTYTDDRGEKMIEVKW